MRIHILSKTNRFVLSTLQKRGTLKMSQPLAAISAGENIPEHPAKMQKTVEEAFLKVKKLSENATLPKRGSAGAAGYDLARYVGNNVGREHFTNLNFGTLTINSGYMQCRGSSYSSSW